MPNQLKENKSEKKFKGEVIQLIITSFPWSTAFSALLQDPSIWRSSNFLLFLLYGSLKQENPRDGKFSFTYLLILGLVVELGIGDFIIIVIIIHSLELFTSALADGFSQESEWQQVSSSLQDSS